MSVRSFLLQLQPRDLALLRDLYESRVMTMRHAAALHFGGSYEAARKRLGKLKSAGFIALRARPAGEEAVVCFTREAYRVLKDGGHLERYPPLHWESLEKRWQVSELTLRHELDVMTLKTAFVTAVAGHAHLTIRELSTWPRLFQFRAARHLPKHGQSPTLLVKPDAFLRIEEQEPDGGASETYFYLEVDRGTETVERILSRQHAYLDHHRRGGLPHRFGHGRGEWERWPFRVLWTFKSIERLCNVAEAMCLSQPEILGQAWMTTFPEATTSDPLGPIWIRPQDYRRALLNTPFDLNAVEYRSNRADVYKRQSERERFVLEKASRRTLLC